MGEKTFLNQGALTVEVHPQLRYALIKSKMEEDIRNHRLIHATLIISKINVMVGNQMHASDVDRRIILLKIVQNRTLRIMNFTGT